MVDHRFCMSLQLIVDCSVLRSPASGVGIYVNEILRRLHRDKIDVVARPKLTASRQSESSPSSLVSFVRQLPGAYRLRNLALGWPPLKKDELFWAPNFLLPGWPLVPPRGVVTIQDLIFVDHPTWADPVRSRFFLRQLPSTLTTATRVIITTQATGAALLRHFKSHLSAEKLVCIPLGIRTLATNTGSENSHEEAVVAYGNLEPRKDFLTLIKAHQNLLPALRRRHPLVITGYPLDRSYARRLVAACDPPHARIENRLHDEALGSLVHRSKVVVAPSLAEGFGLVPLEAYVAGAPVIAADIAVTRELLGDLIRYFNPGDISSLVAALTDALGDRARPSADERNKIAEKFSWEKTAAAHEKLFLSL